MKHANTPQNHTQLNLGISDWFESFFTAKVACPYIAVLSVEEDDDPSDIECREVERLCRENFNGSTVQGELDETRSEIALEYDEEDRDDLAGCTATVGQLETCLNDAFRQSEDYVKRASCDDIDAFLQEEDEEDPASCLAIETLCPGFDLDF